MGRTGTAFLRNIPAELAHTAGLRLLNSGAIKYLPVPKSRRDDVELSVSVPGIGRLKHPIGLAAGFDKNCHCPKGFADLGFSMLEVGTVTPFAQSGNPKPRLFRQPDQRAIINRMGFNNDGAKAVAARVDKLRWDHSKVPLGINIGKNKNTSLDRALDDYIEAHRAFQGLCQYYVVNISSPNTPGLRELATPHFLAELSHAFSGAEKGVWVKLDPDMPKEQFQKLVEVIADRGFPGIILTNTHRVDWPEKGGQSGHPVSIASTRCLEWAWEVHRGQLSMIGCGGILSGMDIFEKIIRGASAVQIYTALVYRGPWVVGELLDELAAEMRLRGINNIEDVYGSFYK
jgi:dihydroorotate dehydrogenase